MDYLLYLNEQWNGPYSVSEIRRRLDASEITPEHSVCVYGSQDVFQIKEREHLFSGPKTIPLPPERNKQDSSISEPVKKEKKTNSCLGCLWLVVAFVGITAALSQCSSTFGKFSNIAGEYHNGTARIQSDHGVAYMKIEGDGKFSFGYTRKKNGQEFVTTEMGHLEKDGDAYRMIAETARVTEGGLDEGINVEAKMLHSFVVTDSTIKITDTDLEVEFDRSTKQ